MQNKYTREQRIKTLHAELREIYGPGKYRITVFVEVHVYDNLPDSTEMGWQLLGDLDQAETYLGIKP